MYIHFTKAIEEEQECQEDEFRAREESIRDEIEKDTKIRDKIHMDIMNALAQRKRKYNVDSP